MASRYRHYIFMLKPAVPSPSCDVSAAEWAVFPPRVPRAFVRDFCRQGEQLQRRCVRSCQSARWVLTKCLHGGKGVQESTGSPLASPSSRASFEVGGGDVIAAHRLLVCVGATAAAAKTTDDLHFLFETFPSLEQRGLPGLRQKKRKKRKKSEARRGTEQKEKAGGEKVWGIEGGIKREKQARFQFDKADMKVGRREQTKGNREKVLTVILFDSSFPFPSPVVI